MILDDFQHHGLGTELVRRSIEVARAEKLKRVISNILPENLEMRAVCQRLGFKLHHEMEDNVVRGVLEL